MRISNTDRMTKSYQNNQQAKVQLTDSVNTEKKKNDQAKWSNNGLLFITLLGFKLMFFYQKIIATILCSFLWNLCNIQTSQSTVADIV